MKSLIKPLRDIGFVTIALTLALVGNFTYAQWANPNEAPTGGNIVAPINIGTTGQVKDGGLGANSMAVRDGFAFAFSNTTGGGTTAWRLENNDGTGNFLTYLNTLGGLSPLFETSGHAFKEIYNPGDGSYRFLTSSAAGAAGNAITWRPAFTLASNGNVNVNQVCDINGANCWDPAAGGPSGGGGVPRNFEVGSLLMAALTGNFPAGASIGYGQIIAGNNICPAGLFLYDTNDNDKIGIVDGSGTSCNMTVPGRWQVLGDTVQNAGINLTTGNTRASITLFQRVEDSVPISPTYYWRVSGVGSCSVSSPRCGGGNQSVSYACINSATGATVSASNCGPNTNPSTRSCNRDQSQCTCFVAGTKVQMADGTAKNIEDVTIGEDVLGTDGVVNKVLGYDRPMLGSRLLYSFNGGTYFVTSEHPFLTTDGWKSISVPALIAEDPALAAELGVTTLEVGDEIIRLDGSTQLIETIDSQSALDQQLYNLKLDGNNTYHADEYVTHNKSSR